MSNVRIKKKRVRHRQREMRRTATWSVAGGLTGAAVARRVREGRSEVGAKRARLRLQLPSRRSARTRHGSDGSPRSRDRPTLSRPSLDLASRLAFISSFASSVFRARDRPADFSRSLAPSSVSAARNRDCFPLAVNAVNEVTRRRSSIRRKLRQQGNDTSRHVFIFLFASLYRQWMWEMVFQARVDGACLNVKYFVVVEQYVSKFAQLHQVKNAKRGTRSARNVSIRNWKNCCVEFTGGPYAVNNTVSTNKY